MSDLGIDDDLIRWTQFFLTNKWIELVIDRYINPKYKVETRIPQRLLVSLILFLIYDSGVFEQVKKELSEIISLLFIDNLDFVASGTSVKEIAKALRKVGNLVVE